MGQLLQSGVADMHALGRLPTASAQALASRRNASGSTVIDGSGLDRR